MVNPIHKLWAFLGTRKRFWLLPLVILLLAIVGLVLLVGMSSMDQYTYELF